MSEATLATGSDYEPLLVAEILRARRSIWLQTFLFDMTFQRDTERRARRIAHLLLDAASDGLDVRVLLASPGPTSVAIPNRTTAIYCSILGLEVRLSQRNVASHRKLAVFDSARCLVGGHNITHGGLSLNKDVSILVEGQRLAAQAGSLFAQCWETAFQPRRGSSLTGRMLTGGR